MNAQDIILGSRVAHVRELKSEIEKLKAENQRLRDENAELNAHFDFALTAAEDLRTLPEGGRLVLVDGWNLILGAGRTARDRDELERQAQEHIAAHPNDIVWIVLDGPHPATRVTGRVRVTYTGGSGLHRADKFICDFVRMAQFRGDLTRLAVQTRDKDFRKSLTRLGAPLVG